MREGEWVKGALGDDVGHLSFQERALGRQGGGRREGRGEETSVPLEARRRPQSTMGRHVIATRGTWATCISLSGVCGE